MPARNPLHPIPSPSRKPLVGHLLSIGADSPVLDMWRLAQQLGGIYWLDLPGMPVVVVSDHELVNEIVDEKRFDKSTLGTLRRLRAASHGLFTSDTHEPTWQTPHNILLPNFSQRAMQGYHPMMLDIAQQLVSKWERLNFDDEVDVTRDMTALTLDTIGLCGFGYRFNSFYREGFHPFVQAMVRTLETAQDRRGLPLEKLLLKKKLNQQRKDIRFMHQTVEAIIRERRASGVDLVSQPDLLNYMIAGVDRKTGATLDDRMIRDECIEFLIAGHETTSGLLSFALYYLLKNPAVLAKAQEEVDRVWGTDSSVLPTYAQVNQLQYVGQILKEALRLYPTAPAVAKRALANTKIGEQGRYSIHKRNMIVLHVLAMHRDRRVWGEDADAFNPDHFSPEAERALPPNAYKPFGTGRRACIGRQFALQEATLTLGLLIQRFELVDHQNYQLKIKEALTLKPDGFRMQVRRRKPTPRAPTTALPRAEAPLRGGDGSGPATVAFAPRHGTPLLVLHGSNLGSAEALARQLSDEGMQRGYVVQMASLDDHVERLPTHGAVLIVCASYNGAPPDNAVQFWQWLEERGTRGSCAKTGEGTALLSGVRFGVFGCGNTDWAATYQAIPRGLDAGLAAQGATRMLPRGEGNARENQDEAFQRWTAALWPALAQALGVKDEAPTEAAALYTLEVLPPPAGGLAQALGAQPWRVLHNQELQQAAVVGASPERSTRHLELQLPAGVHYREGDHLCVLPRNSAASVARVMRHFDLASDAHVRLQATAHRQALLPLGEVLPLAWLLQEQLSLQEVVTRRQLAVLLAHTRCPFTQRALQAWLGEEPTALARYGEEVQQPRLSVLDVLMRFAAIELPLVRYLEMLPLLAPRYYSLSSSPQMNPAQASITVGVVRGAARSGQGEFEGVCSSYLAQLQVGDTLQAWVRPAPDFALPADPGTPLILIGAGTGLAPFRGFLQARAARQAQGLAQGEALLFFGCRHPAQDFLYRDELLAWAQAGCVQLHTAFSRQGPDKVYVQDRVREQADTVWRLLQAGARVYVCGDGARMEPAVRRTLQALASERGAEGAAWLSGLIAERRYALDVWTSD